jgi:hypothetical protein
MLKNLNIIDIPHKYNIDELTCYEHPVATAINYFDSRICNVYILLSKLYGIYVLNIQTNRKKVLDYLKEYTDTEINFIKKLTWKKLKENIDKGVPLIVGVNLYDIEYSDNYLKNNWGHWFLIKGYDETNGTVIVLDNAQHNDIGERYSEFRITYDTLIKAHKSFVKKYPEEIHTISLLCSNNATYTYNAQIKQLLDVYMSVDIKEDISYRQYHILNELEKIKKGNSGYEEYYTEELKKRLLNINKYREVFFNELCISMEYFGYKRENINCIKEKVNQLNNQWKIFILKYSISISNGYNKEIVISEEIKKIEIDIRKQLEDYGKYLEKKTMYEKNNEVKSLYISDIDTNKSNKITYMTINNDDDIISGDDECIKFSFVKNRLYNWWIDDNAPKICLAKYNFDDVYSGKCIYVKSHMNISIVERFTSGERYQAGFYVKTYDDNSSYMCALSGQEEWSLDKVGYEGNKLCSRSTYDIFMRVTKGNIIFGEYEEKNNEEKTLIERTIADTGEFEIGLACKTWEKSGKIIVEFIDTELTIK